MLDFPNTPTNGQTFTGPDGAVWVYDGVKWRAQSFSAGRGSASATPGNPTGTSSAAGVMSGVSVSVTPVFIGAVFVMFTGSMLNNAANAGAQVGLRYGTGTAPANGAALAGTQAQAPVFSSIQPANAAIPFCVSMLITGLTVGTAYWFGLSQYAVTSGTMSLSNISGLAFEA